MSEMGLSSMKKAAEKVRDETTESLPARRRVPAIPRPVCRAIRRAAHLPSFTVSHQATILRLRRGRSPAIRQRWSYGSSTGLAALPVLVPLPALSLLTLLTLLPRLPALAVPGAAGNGSGELPVQFAF